MKHLLVSLFLALFASSLAAQIPPQPQFGPPPPLDLPTWEIHSPDGPMGLSWTAEFWYNDGFCDIYVIEVTGTVGGQSYYDTGLAFDCGDPNSIDIFTNDSGQWVTLEWQGDHYNKVGGTEHRRKYYPVY